MKFPGAIVIAFLTALPLSAQFGNIVFPGLLHAPTGGNPWGNVVTPALPQGAAVTATRYGGLVPAFTTGTGAHRRNTASGVYVYPVYIGGSGYAAQPPADNSQPDQPGQPPVIVNQYFNSPAPQDAAPQSNTDATPPPDTTYYLIAFKDHSVYSAVAYYFEGDTLHYFTAGNIHNQASLSLVDRPLTEQLNRTRNIEVRFP